MSGQARLDCVLSAAYSPVTSTRKHVRGGRAKNNRATVVSSKMFLCISCLNGC